MPMEGIIQIPLQPNTFTRRASVPFAFRQDREVHLDAFYLLKEFELELQIISALQFHIDSLPPFCGVARFRSVVERHLDVEVTGFGRYGRPIRLDVFGLAGM
ncbi:hypothetical protein J1N35_033215 [Gossypium stocksii]|uniref:Uncharacterized protein n=1 Tax=Gossypium stocksii TaxID=47602 RepID=A0A9D3ZPD2_9ROSI|nr:hypothetical protein J1N35_033215 [Gossypium stocksii]